MTGPEVRGRTGVEILVNSSPEEHRVVLLEAGKPVEVHVERAQGAAMAGDVYLGRVDKVVPGMQAAFVDVGLERHAFLHVTDVIPEDDAEGGDAPRAEGSDTAPAAGEDSPGATESTPGPQPRQEARRQAALDRRIEDYLREGQEVLVQVTREPIGHKGPRVTAQVSLPGSFLVHLPLTRHVGVSKRIEPENDRHALRRTVESLRGDDPGGFIVRTAATGRPPEELRGEMDALRESWRSIQARVAQAEAPAKVHGEPAIPLRIIRDSLAAEVSRIVVDDDDLHRQVIRFMERHAPSLVAVVQLHRGEPLFEAFGLEQEIEKALRDRVWLKSGGYLVINEMEALVSIDVNTGKYSGGRRLEETALQTNLEAAREVARQLRLRDLGGIVVVDFIDMLEAGHRARVMAEIAAGLSRDRARTTVLGMSDFGVVEITRQRQRRSLLRSLTDACPYCGGGGRVKSAETTGIAILRRLRALATTVPGRQVTVKAHPDVVGWLRSREAELRGAGIPLAVKMAVQDDPGRHRETFDISS